MTPRPEGMAAEAVDEDHIRFRSAFPPAPSGVIRSRVFC
jgi:hypothetical protein